MGNSKKNLEFINNVAIILREYERSHKNYEVSELTNYLKDRGYDFSEELTNKWIDFVTNDVNSDICNNVIEVLEELKKNNIKMSVATNWFTVSQKGRLERAGLLNYFDNVVGGDYAVKPNSESLLLARGDTPIDECLVVGDDYENDFMGAINIGMMSVLIDDDHELKSIIGGILNDRRSKKRIRKRY